MIYILIYIEIEKVDVFRKVLNKQLIERLRAIFIKQNTITHPYRLFHPLEGSSGGPKPRNKTLKRFKYIYLLHYIKYI